MWLSNRKQFNPNLGQTLNLGCLCISGGGDNIRADLVDRDHEGIHGETIF